MREDHTHGDEVQRDQQQGGQRHPPKGGQPRPDEQAETGDAEQQQTEPDGQRVTLVGTGADRFGLHGVYERQDEQIEHAAAQDVAHGDVR